VQNSWVPWCHAPSNKEAEVRGSWVQGSPGYIARLCLRKKLFFNFQSVLNIAGSSGTLLSQGFKLGDYLSPGVWDHPRQYIEWQRACLACARSWVPNSTTKKKCVIYTCMYGYWSPSLTQATNNSSSICHFYLNFVSILCLSVFYFEVVKYATVLLWLWQSIPYL
jgi:hypothetical protein